MISDPTVIVRQSQAAATHEAAHAVFAVALGLYLRGTFLRDRDVGTVTAIGKPKGKKERKRMAFCLAAASAAERYAGFPVDGGDAQDRKDAKKNWKRGDFDKLSAAASLVIELPGVWKAIEETAAALMGRPGEMAIRGRSGDVYGDEVRRIVETHVRGDVVGQVSLICRAAVKKAKKSKEAA